MKPRTIISTALVAAALIAPAAQARTDNSAQIHGLMVRSQGLNRVYGLGTYAPTRVASDTANSDAVARYVANRTEPDAIARYLGNRTTSTTPAFYSDVANSNEVARINGYGTSASSGGDGTFSSSSTIAEIAGCLLLVSVGGFLLVRRSQQPVRPV